MEKLYEQDSFLIEFEAQVLSCVKSKKGFDLVLDRTAFYPEGGGQPWDTGWLEVKGVQEKNEVLEVHSRDGQVVHTCKRPLDAGTAVTGIIDWERRFDLMQQHSGEHVVSGLAHALWGCENVGFHLGAEVVTIDLSLPLTLEQCAHLEENANRYLWLDIPVEVSWPAPEKLADLPYRSKKELTGPVRIVEFPGADCCACCGTHVRSAGQIGLIKLLSVQKFREGCRIELVCGARALAYLNRVFQQNNQVSHLLSAKLFETGMAVERLLAENERLKDQLQTLEEDHFRQLARQYTLQGNVLHFEDGLSPASLCRLCIAVCEICNGRCACFSGSDSDGYRYAIGEMGGALNDFSRQLNQALNGRGGGKPDFIQGSVQATRQEIEAFFQETAP